MDDKHKQKRKSFKNYNNAQSIVTSMILYIASGVGGGIWLDNQFSNGKNIFVIIGSLLGIAGAMYHAIKIATNRK